MVENILKNIHELLRKVHEIDDIAVNALMKLLEQIDKHADDLTKSLLICGVLFKDCTLVQLGLRRLLVTLDRKNVTKVDLDSVMKLIVTVCGSTKPLDPELSDKLDRLIQRAGT